MPLLAGTAPVVPVTPGGGTVPPVFIEDVGTLQATWTDPDGEVYQLTDISPDLGWFTTQGPSGWGANPIELVTDPLPRGGEQVRYIRVQPRNIVWPLHIWGDTHQEFVTRYRRLMRGFTMTTYRQMPGILTIARPDGKRRMIYAYYKEGFGGEPGENWLSANPALTLFCPDGYWMDVQDTIITRGQAVETSFYNPFMTIGSSQVLGDTSIFNPGEIEAWPRWTITGPMQKLTAVNVTLGVQFALTYALGESQQIKITTNRPTVRGPGDANLTGYLDWPAAVLWPLAAGENVVQFQVDGAGPTTKIDMGFRARYEGA